jgi:hypothetical protein
MSSAMTLEKSLLTVSSPLSLGKIPEFDIRSRMKKKKMDLKTLAEIMINK